MIYFVISPTKLTTQKHKPTGSEFNCKWERAFTCLSDYALPHYPFADWQFVFSFVSWLVCG